MASIPVHLTGEAVWGRVERVVERIQERLEKTARTLEQAGIPYAIIGGNAVRAWVAQADEAAVRTTRDVQLVDASWCFRFPPDRAARLAELLDNPNG